MKTKKIKKRIIKKINLMVDKIIKNEPMLNNGSKKQKKRYKAVLYSSYYNTI